MTTSTIPHNRYFTQFSWGKLCLYMAAFIYVMAAIIASLIEPWLDLPCENPGERLEFENPSFVGTHCRYIRYFVLAGFNRQECAFARQLVASCFLGGLIGWERRQGDRPAGIRTMSLVSLGSCLFTINSTFAFLNGPMAWDASRVSAAIPSGVGFLGAGLIFKKEQKSEGESSSTHVVHGLTTAASLWLSAAVGIACGGELYMPAGLVVAVMMLVLRFGPRGSEDDSGEDFETPLDKKVNGNESYASIGAPIVVAADGPVSSSELSSLMGTKPAMSTRKRQAAHLANIV